jgi:hypothetical protein
LLKIKEINYFEAIKIIFYLALILLIQALLTFPLYTTIDPPVTHIILLPFYGVLQLFLNVFIGWFWGMRTPTLPKKSYWICGYFLFFAIFLVFIFFSNYFILDIQNPLYWPWISGMIVNFPLFEILIYLSLIGLSLIYIIFFYSLFPPGDYLLPYATIAMAPVLLLSILITYISPIVTFNYGFRLTSVNNRQRDRINLKITFFLFILVFLLMVLLPTEIIIQ